MKPHQLQQLIDDVNVGFRNRLLIGWLLQFGLGLTGLVLMASGLRLARMESEVGGNMLFIGELVILSSLVSKLGVSMIPGMNRRSGWTRLLSIVACAVVAAYWAYFNLLGVLPESSQVMGFGVLIGIALTVEIGYLARELYDFFH